MDIGDLFPTVGAATVCEINCRLVTLDAAVLKSGKRNATVGAPVFPEILLSSGGHTKFLADYAPVITIPEGAAPAGEDSLRSPSLQRSHSSSGPIPAHSAKSPLLKLLNSPLQMLFPSLYGSCVDAEGWGQDKPPSFAWHPRHQVLAAADRADRIHVYNVEPVAPALGSAKAELPASLHPDLVLYHEFQQQVRVLAWRPPCGSVLATGCSRGICLWMFGGGPAGAYSPSQRGSTSAWMTFLRSQGSTAVTALAWSPCGKLLASGSVGSTGIDIWHVALGVRTHLQSTCGGTHLLRWSPCGSYLLSGGLDERFLVWETQQWRAQAWQCSGSGRLIEAAWKPDGRAVALAFSRSTQLVMLHFTQRAPSLSAQMLPLDLPELRMCENPEIVEISRMQWDPAGGRLAIVMNGHHPAKGLVALYATTSSSIVTARFLGFIRPPFMDANSIHDGGEDSLLDLAFQGGFRQGALLAIRRGEGHISMVPMYFSK